MMGNALYESYKNYRPEAQSDFITIMGEIILNHKTQIVTIMGKDVGKYL